MVNLGIFASACFRNTYSKVIMIVCAIMCSAVSAFNASFDCASPNLLPDETTICSNPKLSSLDSLLTALYSKILNTKSGNERTQFINSQRQWLKERADSCRTDVFCMIKHYEKRIEELEAMAKKGPVSCFEDGVWVRLPFEGYDVGELKMTNSSSVGFEFELSAASGAHAGLIEGYARLVSPEKARYYGVEYPCTLKF